MQKLPEKAAKGDQRVGRVGRVGRVWGSRGERGGARGGAGCGARPSPFNSTICINVFMSLPSTMKGRSPSLNTVIQNALHKCNKTTSPFIHIEIKLL